MSSQIQRLADALRDLAEDTGHLSGTVHEAARRLDQVAQQVAQIQRGLPLNLNGVLGAVGAAGVAARRASVAAHLVASEGGTFADRLADGGVAGTGGTTAPSHEPGAATPTPAVASIAEVQGWVAEINPNYDHGFGPYSTNCGSCALATARRLNGDSTAEAEATTLSVSEMEAATGVPQVPMTPAEIESALRAKGPGSHAVIGIDRDGAPGHWFNAYFDGDEVVTIDGQDGSVNGWPPDPSFPGHPVTRWDAGIL